VSLRRSRHVWVDHCSFTSGGPAQTPTQPQRLGQLFQQTDGLLDITRQSDLVTVSWCRFSQHDKTMLIGSSDKQTEDDGRLRVSLHHNLWLACKERTPRVRFGRVHIANNLFVAPRADAYAYSIGLGHEARIVSQANAWETDPAISADKLVRALKGTRFGDQGSLHNGQPVALAAALRRANPGLVLDERPAFDPPPVAGLLPAGEMAARVRAIAGAATDAKRAPMVHNSL
jgi:pectate lyase